MCGLECTAVRLLSEGTIKLWQYLPERLRDIDQDVRNAISINEQAR